MAISFGTVGSSTSSRGSGVQGGWGVQHVNTGDFATAGGSSGGASGDRDVTTTTETTTTMAPAAEAALNALIQQLASGGTPEQQQQRAARNQEIADARNIRQDYSKENAFRDAQGAMQAQLNEAMTKSLAELARAAEGAGTSASAMRALLLQNAQQKAAESAATLGLQASVNYGQVASGLTSTLEALTRPNDAVTQSLINALGVAKGANVNTTKITDAPARSTGGFSGGGGVTRSAPSSSSDSSSFWKQFDSYGRPKMDGGSNFTSYGPVEPLKGDSMLSGLSSY